MSVPKLTTLTILDEVHCKFDGLDPVTRRKMVEALKFTIPSARHLPAVKMGRWDGTISFCTAGASTYINLLPMVLQIVIDAGYEITVKDNRQVYDLEFPEIDQRWLTEVLSDPRWQPGHPHAGEEILLRDYQVDVINAFIQNPHSVQSVATGAGKCLHYETMISITVNNDSKLLEFIADDKSGEAIVTPTSTVTYLETSIGWLVTTLTTYLDMHLCHDSEVCVKDLGIAIQTPNGNFAQIEHVITKMANGVTVKFTNGHILKCAAKHIIQKTNGVTIYAADLKPGMLVECKNTIIEVNEIIHTGHDVYFDISIPSPHLYYDAYGIVHHNTLITATLSKLVEPHGRSVVIVPSKSLVEQTEADYKNLGLDVGVFYGDRKEINKTHTICTWQSLAVLDKKSKKWDKQAGDLVIDELLSDVICVMVDECHSAKADKLKELLCGPMRNVPLRWGLSGTIPKVTSDFISVVASVGDVVNELKAKTLQDNGVLAKCHVNVIQLQDNASFNDYHAEYDFLMSNKDRIRWMTEYIKHVTVENGNTLVLVNRLEVGDMLTDMIPGAVFVCGSTSSKNRKNSYDDINTSDNGIVVATYGVAAVGINIPRLFNIVLIEPGKSLVRVIQSIGRGIRKAKDKDFTHIHDITSSCKFAKRHLTERKALYTEAGYPYTVTKVDY